jgi:hypothetical protein
MGFLLVPVADLELGAVEQGSGENFPRTVKQRLSRPSGFFAETD